MAKHKLTELLKVWEDCSGKDLLYMAPNILDSLKEAYNEYPPQTPAEWLCLYYLSLAQYAHYRFELTGTKAIPVSSEDVAILNKVLKEFSAFLNMLKAKTEQEVGDLDSLNPFLKPRNKENN